MKSVLKHSSFYIWVLASFDGAFKLNLFVCSSFAFNDKFKPSMTHFGSQLFWWSFIYLCIHSNISPTGLPTDNRWGHHLNQYALLNRLNCGPKPLDFGLLRSASECSLEPRSLPAANGLNTATVGLWCWRKPRGSPALYLDVRMWPNPRPQGVWWWHHRAILATIRQGMTWRSSNGTDRKNGSRGAEASSCR